jgi:(E)-4-hydroxy-3-methyl-but-2-enyl pyrophosphate reductase
MRSRRSQEPTIVFSAHGVPPSFHDAARERGLQILDTTCKFVYDIHREAKKALEGGFHLVFIGDPAHREVIGYTNDLDPASYHIVSRWPRRSRSTGRRTRRSRSSIRRRSTPRISRTWCGRSSGGRSGVERGDTICYATKENQDAAKVLAEDPEVDVIIVIGGKKSANTKHLWEICREAKPSFLVQGADDIDPTWLAGANVVGLTAGSSTPDYVIDEVESALAGIA